MVNAKKITDKLNKTVKNYNDTEKGKVDCSFYCGGNKAVADIINNDFPLSHGVALLTESDFVCYNAVNNGVKEKGGAIFSIVLKKDFNFSVENVCGIFNVSDDTRYIVVFNRNLLEVGLYYATVRNIPVIYAFPYSVKGDIFPTSIDIKSGTAADCFDVSCKKYVVLSEEKNVSSLYVNVIKHLLTLIDYRFCYGVQLFSSGEFFSFNLLRDCVKNAYSIEECENKAEDMLYYFLLSELSNLFSGGKLFAYSSIVSAEKILKNGDLSDYHILELFIKLYRIYGVYFKENIIFPIIVDYNERAEKLSRIINRSENQLINNYKSQLSAMERAKKRIAQVKETLKKEVRLTCSLLPETEKTFFSLGGTKTDGNPDNYAIKYAGDFDKINITSFIRETGILEGIKD